MHMHRDLTAGRASYIYLITLVLLLIGSSVSSILIGFGWSLWVNQGVFVAIAAILAWKNKWSWRDVYRFRGTSVATCFAALFTGFGLWWGGLAFNIWSERLVIRYFGIQPDLGLELTALDPFLMIIALVLLAPIGEEILFRGYFLRAFESETAKPWIWSGLFFGIMHIGNGLPSVIPATIYGFVMGYIVWRSGSLIAGMIAHMGVNVNAVFMGGLFQGSVGAASFDQGLLIVSFIGLLVLLGSFLWFKKLQSSKPMPTAPEKTGMALRPLHWGALALIALILIGLGVMDMAVRVDEPTTGRTSISAGSFTGDSRFGEIEVTKAPVTLELTYELSSDVLDAVLAVLDPDENVVWSEEFLNSRDIFVQSAEPVVIVLDREGVWQISLKGSGQGLQFDAQWTISH